MTSCSHFENKGILFHYQELPDAEAKAYLAHLASCAECRTQMDAIKGTLSILDQRETISPDEAFWQKFDVRLRDAVSETPGPEKRGLIRFPWAQGLAAVALLVIGVWIGTQFSRPKIPQAIPKVDLKILPDDLFFEQAGNYVQRSKTLLIGMVNMDIEGLDDAAIDLSLQRRMSRELISQASFLRDHYPKRGGDRLLELINELEIIFLQIAHLEANGSVEGLEIIRYGLDQSDLMLKINLEQLQPSIPKPPPEDGVRL